MVRTPPLKRNQVEGREYEELAAQRIGLRAANFSEIRQESASEHLLLPIRRGRDPGLACGVVAAATMFHRIFF